MNLQNMAPNAKRSLLLTLVFGALAAGIYLTAVETAERQLVQARRSLQSCTVRHRTMAADLARAEQVQGLLESCERRLAFYRGKMIEPLLESTAMRAKAHVDALASGCGLSGMEYEANEPIALPILGKAARRQYARCPIRISCRGSYQAAVSFIQCVEKDFPFVACESLSVASLADPEVQQVIVTLEWPMAKGDALK